jgi:hypothetical protein
MNLPGGSRSKNAALQAGSRNCLSSKQLFVRSITSWPESYDFFRGDTVTLITHGERAISAAIFPASG